MFGFIKNKFAFILGISILTLILLVVGAFSLYKDTRSTFDNDGYIISTTTKKSAKHYFSANTKYKDNADDKVVFKNNKSETVSVDPASFVHYNNGSIAFLQQGALVNLSEINSPIVSYYNVTRDNIVKKSGSRYILTSNGNDISVESFIGRISDDKYIVAGNNLSIEIPTNESKISGDYFELTFIKGGIVKIDNKSVSYQVTAQNTFINVGNKIRINLGNEKIYYDGSAKLLLSQITINGDENIDLDVKKSSSEGGGEGESDEEGMGNSLEDGDNNDNSNTTSDGTATTTPGTNTTASQGGTDSEKNGSGSGKGSSSEDTDSVKIDLIDARVNAIGIDASFQLNNAILIKGKLVAILTNVSNNEQEEPVVIPAVNGTFNVTKKALQPDTEYNLVIMEDDKNDPKQYFQKSFRTKELGISLERQYVTDDSLTYNVIFDENTDVTKAKVSIYNNSFDGIADNEFVVSKNDNSSLVLFNDLYSNKSYSVIIDTVWIDNIAYKDLYSINRIDTTLKKTPVLSDIQIKANSDEVKFNIKVNNIEDPDKGIVSYTYKVYKSDSINLDGVDPEMVYSVTKDNDDAIDLDLTKIDALKTGVNYRCKVFAQYNDNEMIREVESDFSGNFLIKSKPNITWKGTSTTADRIVGDITLVDVSCSVPVSGRTCMNGSNNFILKYYKVTEGESSAKEINLTFNGETLTSHVDISSELNSSTAYGFKLFANYYDDENNLHSKVQIGDPFFVTTDKSTKVVFTPKKDNISGKDANGAEIVTFDAALVKPADSNADEDTASITLNLYSGNYNIEDKLIGTYTITDRNLIDDFYNNFTITNILFENESVGKLDSLQKMIQVTNNQEGTLNRSYTVEVAEIVSQNGSTDSIEIQNPLYTFNLTASYYLDSRIASNPNYKYVNVTTIAKKDLSEEEYASLSSKISHLDDLADDTIVGITIDSSLTDEFVDSAFKVKPNAYEKVVVDYVVYNVPLNKEVKRVSINMDNKYQPKSQTIYLDATGTEEDDLFVRGFDYKIGYELNFSFTEGEQVTYTNDKLYERKIIPREYPTVRQYVSSSTVNSVTYKYAITDVDYTLKDKSAYYMIDGESQFRKINGNLVVDGNYHEFTVPFTGKAKYSVYLGVKGTDGNLSYLPMANQKFDSLYGYDDSNVYTLVNDTDNTLKIKFVNNEFTERAVAYRVRIKAKDDDDIVEFNRIFLASKLETEAVGTGEFDEEGKEIKTNIKYIAIDYAYISRFLKHNLEVHVEEFYDTGLMGMYQNFDNGFILENFSVVNGVDTYKYLNIYNGAKENDNLVQATDAAEGVNNSILMFKVFHPADSTEATLYNYIEDVGHYNKSAGASYYLNPPTSSKVGIFYNIAMDKNVYKDNALISGGLIYNNKFSNYIPKVVNVTDINTSDNSYRFNDIIPRVSLKTSTATINSLKLNITSSGVYGQFIKNGAEHNTLYLDVYSDEELTHKITTLTSDLTISENVIEAAMVEYKNLTPNTTYYITVSGYIDNKLTRLYDTDEAGYVTKVYQLKTLDSKGILSKINFRVEPVSYSGVTSQKELSWSLGLKNKENYKIRFELFNKDGAAVKFDGAVANSCSTGVYGSSTNGFVSGCYIQVSKDNVQDLVEANLNKYTFVGDDFVFGDGYYKLKVYAIPYTNNAYKETDKLLLYENTALKTEKKDITGGISYDIKIPTLERPSFSFKNLIAGIRCVTQKDADGNAIRENGEVVCANDEENEVYIEFSIDVKDDDYVIRNGRYDIQLNDINDDTISIKENISATAVNKTFTFTGLVKDSTYNVEIIYESYRNNSDLSEEEKLETLNQNNYVSTPLDKGVTPGNIMANADGDSKIILSYDRYNKIEKISRVEYTIQLNSSSTHKISGVINIGSEEDKSFVVTDSRLKQTLTIDFSEDEIFRLSSGNSYLIITKYYYKVGNVEYGVVDGNSVSVKSFATILNL